MEFRKFSPGDRVLIFQKLDDHWNQNGEMDHWLGQVVTIKGNAGESGGIPQYYIEEDQQERGDYGWVWREDCLEFVDAAPMLEEADLMALLEVM